MMLRYNSEEKNWDCLFVFSCDCCDTKSRTWSRCESRASDVWPRLRRRQRRSVDWGRFSGDQHVEQSGSSAAASGCRGISLFSTQLKDRCGAMTSRGGGGRGVCWTSASEAIIKITPVAVTHGWKSPLEASDWKHGDGRSHSSARRYSLWFP